MANTVTQVNGSKNEKRSTMKKSFMAIIIFLILIDFIFLAFIGFWAIDASAQMDGQDLRPGFRDHSGYGRGNNKPSENKSFNLSPIQEDRLKVLRRKFLDETVFIRSEIPRKLLELRKLWTDPEPDRDKINTKKKEIINLFTQLQIKATDLRLEAQTFLTPEQVEKLQVFNLHLEIEPNWALSPTFSPGLSRDAGPQRWAR